MAGYSYRLERYRYDYGHTIQAEIGDETRELIASWPEPEPNELGETRGTQGHGSAAYRWKKCRCPTCITAKARENRAYKDKRRAKR
jgi:hypothetical protein